MGYIGVITHLLTIDPNFLREIIHQKIEFDLIPTDPGPQEVVVMELLDTLRVFRAP